MQTRWRSLYRRLPRGGVAFRSKRRVSGAGLFDRDPRNVEFNRVLALSDGVFAIALTLLVLSLEVPRGLAAGELGGELLNLSPMLVAHVLLNFTFLLWIALLPIDRLIKRHGERRPS